MFLHLWNDQDFTDVTLATVDNHQINAHKVILSSCSQFFRNILLRNPHQNPLLYLKDIRLKELEMVLKFIYLGQCEVGHSELTDFLSTGKALQISGLRENIDMKEKEMEPFIKKEKPHQREYSTNESDSPMENEYPRNNIESQGIILDDVTWEITSDSQVENEIINIKPTKTNDDGKYSCDQCDKKYAQKGILGRHRQITHEKVRYECDQCEASFTQQVHLDRHTKTVHDGVRYECDQYATISTTHGHLNTHKKSVHDGVRYECEQCETTYAHPSGLLRHKKLNHEDRLLL